MVHPLEHPGGIQSDTGTVDDLPIRVVAYAEDLRMLGIIDIQIEVITRQNPVQIAGSELGQRDSRTGNHTLKLVVGTRIQSICKGGYLGLHIRIGNKYGDDLPVVLIEELDGMRERTVSALLMGSQVPEHTIKESLRGFSEEVALLPGDLIDIEHDKLCDLGAVRLIHNVARMRRIRPQGMHRVVEVQDAELRLHLELMPVLEELVIYVLGECGILVVIHAHGVSLGHHLVDDRLVYRVRLTGSRASQDEDASEGIHDIDPSIVHLLLILIHDRQIDGVVVHDLIRTLREGLVVVIDDGLGLSAGNHADHPYESGESDDGEECI